MINLKDLTIENAHAMLVSKEMSVRDLVMAAVQTAKEKNTDINAFVEIFSDFEEAIQKAQEKIDNGTATLLTGIPCAIKDNMLKKGVHASCGSKILEAYVGAYDGTLVQLLETEGAIIIGRTNMDEFAMGSSTETSAFGLTKNPYDTSRVPGGSSGGAAAAVAMGSVLFSFGSDTGGSIRQPAALCNLVGFKPTYGSVSRSGIVALASSLDQIGPFTKTVAETEAVYSVISAHDKRDSTSVSSEVRASYKKTLKKKIGVPYHFFDNGGVQSEILDGFKKTIIALKDSGYEIVPLNLDYIHYSLPAYYIIQPAEASSNLARFDGIRYGTREEESSLFDVYAKTRGKGFGKEVRRRILLGTYVLSHGYYDAYYGKALLMKEKIKEELNSVFETVDVIATPTTASTAFKFGEKSGDPVAMYLEDIFTVPANISGDPAISIPIGFDQNKLPFGLQLIAPAFNEHLLFTIGKDVENTVQ